MLRMRTIIQAYEELKQQDSNTAMTTYSIRRLVKTGAVPSVLTGRRYLINMDLLEEYLSTPADVDPPETTSRQINIKRVCAM